MIEATDVVLDENVALVRLTGDVKYTVDESPTSIVRVVIVVPLELPVLQLPYSVGFVVNTKVSECDQSNQSEDVVQRIVIETFVAVGMKYILLTAPDMMLEFSVVYVPVSSTT